MIFFVASFLFCGYSLVALLKPEENYKQLFKKPVLILEFSVLITLIISIFLKFSFLGLHLKNLVMILSVVIMILSLSTYIKRINYFKNHDINETPLKSEKKAEVSSEKVLQDKKSDEKVLPSEKEKHSKPTASKMYWDLILIAFLSIYIIISYLIKPLNIPIIHYYLGLIYMLFLTGYTLTYILFPLKNELNLKIRLLLSVGISFPLTSIIGLPLYYSKYSFTSISALLPLAVLTLFLCFLAYKRKTAAKQ
jgi:uncharacterized membrane protein